MSKKRISSVLSKVKKERVKKWINKKGCAEFDFKNKDIILGDGGLFSIEKEIKIKPKTRKIFGKLKELQSNGKTMKLRELKFLPIRKKGKIVYEEQEYYKATIWFKELDETISYLVSMKRLLNRLGFETSYKN